ncbi:MAG TPA: hypothetical protein VGF93_04605 [Solirubrobacteraceae bacterium]
MRRKIIILTALLTLVGATAAYGALNTYAGTNQTFSKGSGSQKKPLGMSFKQTLQANNTDPSKAAAVLTHITVKIYGLVSNAKNFPTCSATEMEAKKSDSFCPKKSKFATGLVNSLLGDPTLALSNRIKCNPNLDVFNAGKGKLWFFFTTKTATQCAGLTTGQTAPYPGTVKQQGKFQIVDIPLPADISTRVANQPNFYGSLIKETLNWSKISTKVKGKTVFNNVSVGCKSGKRPWSVTYTATTNGTSKETQTVNGSSKC